jgi:hypothetical protein
LDNQLITLSAVCYKNWTSITYGIDLVFVAEEFVGEFLNVKHNNHVNDALIKIIKGTSFHTLTETVKY